MAATNSPFKLRILVIDNDPTFLASFSASLQLLKHEVLTCRNPICGLSTLRVCKNYYDLVMTDIHLPHMDGFEVIKRVREEFKLPLIVVSGDDRLDVARKALQLGGCTLFSETSSL
ncbi:hypothetical protein M0R45_035270 [Rubus argutus]|uniref:Response regulatory domain-containing protein n=1 Tax=Rubus argutus TaxID=59490 RepID=A0AAW1VV42_RUBAR